MSDVRLGVFICDCGDQIASVLDVDALEREARALPGVAIARRLGYPCSPDGMAVIQSAIAEERLDRVLVAGCTPRTLEPRFRGACEQAGLSGDLFELVDIREGCAWVHQDEPQLATRKALDLIQMGAAQLALRGDQIAAHPPVSAEIVPGALVIGGGVAGMTAALTLANAGQPVKLVERESALGGMLRDVHTLYPDGHNTTELVARKVEAVTCHRVGPNARIEVLLGSQVTQVSGTVGRYIIDVNGAGEPFEVGAIIVATGAHALTPRGQFRYDGRRIVTQLEFERELGDPASDSSMADVVMILCAGQRDQAVPYCSRVCCLGALKQAIEVKAADPQANVTVLHRDLYLPDEDRHKDRLMEAVRAGVEFIRYASSSPPKVTEEAVEIYDGPSGTTLRLPYDRIVLATPLLPQPDAGVVAYMLGIAQDENGFFPEVRHRLRPQVHAERGIYVCGAAHHPTIWTEAEFQATNAAFKALRHLRAGQVSNHAPVAAVDQDLCTGCGNCVKNCPFGAISMRALGGDHALGTTPATHRDKELDLSEINPLLCTGCGNCVVVCPVKAISQPVDSDLQVFAQIESALATTTQNGRPHILVLGCEWSGHAAAELAGANKLSYPVETRLIRTRCSARFDPIHILWAFFNGADGVFLGACPPGDCHYVNGNRRAQERFDTLQRLLAENGFDPRRLRLEWIKPDDPHDFVNKITAFTDLVGALGPSPVLGVGPNA